MSKKSGLGRGLGALLGNVDVAQDTAPMIADTQTDSTSPGYLEVNIFDVDPNPKQPRRQFDDMELEELSASIQLNGIIQPLIVQQNGKRYRIIAGERRWRAAKLAGLKVVPVVIREIAEKNIIEIAMVENLQRSDLNPVEEAEGIRQMMTQHNHTQEEVAQKLSKSRSVIANAVRLLSLTDEVLEMLRQGQLSSGHARALVAIQDPLLQINLAQEISKRQMSVRQAEQLCKQAQEEPKEKKSNKTIPELFEAQNTLQQRLETKVKIMGDGKKGKIVIDYYSQEQLDQLYTWLNRENG